MYHRMPSGLGLTFILIDSQVHTFTSRALKTDICILPHFLVSKLMRSFTSQILGKLGKRSDTEHVATLLCVTDAAESQNRSLHFFFWPAKAPVFVSHSHRVWGIWQLYKVTQDLILNTRTTAHCVLAVTSHDRKASSALAHLQRRFCPEA